MMEKVVKVVVCDRCGGKGGWTGWPGFTCYKCGGSGLMHVHETIRDEKEQAAYEKAKARREAKRLARFEAQRLEAEARERERLEQEAQREAQRLASLLHGFAGTVGEKITTDAVCLYHTHFERRCYREWEGLETVNVYAFQSADNKKLVWFTTSRLEIFTPNLIVHLTGVVKEHSTYRGEDQTTLSRVKIKKFEQ